MREYKIKKGYNPDIGAIVNKYFGASGDINKGINFEVDGIGKVDMKQENKVLYVDIIPPKTITGDYSVIKKWNQFLLEATGKDTKERKKEFGKVKKKK